MKKFKKIIVYLCLFFLSFSIVTDFKRQETQAIALVDDAIFWALGLLILSTGVVAVNGAQITDMGAQLKDKIESNFGQTEVEKMFDVANGTVKGIIITSKLKSLINDVVDSLNGNVYAKSSTQSVSTGEFHFSAPDPYEYSVGFSMPFVSFTFVGPGRVEFGASYQDKPMNGYSGSLDLKQGETLSINLKLVNSEGAWGTRQWKAVDVSSGGSYGGVYKSSDLGVSKYAIKLYNLTAEFTPYILVDYTQPKIKENYNPTYTNENLPYTDSKQGYLPVPLTVPDASSITTEMPLTWDNVKDMITDFPADNTVPGEDTGEEIETPSGWGWLLDILKSILNAILSIPGAILDFFEIDWTLVGEHVVYDEIFKTKFKPFYDVIYLLQNINVNPSTHSGKFYMVIPPEMGGDGQEHCVLDLTVGNEYIVMARAFINASIWIGFLWYIIKLFSPNLDIG